MKKRRGGWGSRGGKREGREGGGKREGGGRRGGWGSRGGVGEKGGNRVGEREEGWE